MPRWCQSAAPSGLLDSTTGFPDDDRRRPSCRSRQQHTIASTECAHDPPALTCEFILDPICQLATWRMMLRSEPLADTRAPVATRDRDRPEGPGVGWPPVQRAAWVESRCTVRRSRFQAGTVSQRRTTLPRHRPTPPPRPGPAHRGLARLSRSSDARTGAWCTAAGVRGCTRFDLSSDFPDRLGDRRPYLTGAFTAYRRFVHVQTRVKVWLHLGGHYLGSGYQV